MPLSEHTGSHSSAEHEQSLLHSEKSMSLLYDTLWVLQGKEGLYFTFWGCEKSSYGVKASSCTRHVSALTRCMRWWAQPRECYHTWCQTGAAGGGMPWRMWQRRAELLTPNSVYTSSSAALPGRSPRPPLAGSTHLKEERKEVWTVGGPSYSRKSLIIWHPKVFYFSMKLWAEVLERCKCTMRHQAPPTQAPAFDLLNFI